MLTKFKFSYLSKIFTARTFQRVSKFYYLQRGYHVNLKNSIYIQLAKQTVCSTKILVPQKIDSRNEEEIIFDKEEEFGFFSALCKNLLFTVRIIVITTIVFGLLTFYWITRLFGIKTFPGIYIKAIEFLGPTFIKLGQWMSTRRDLYPEEVCASLSRLQRGTSAHSWYYTRHVLETTYGSSWSRLFVEFNPVPVGSGCCAQVYKAVIDASAKFEVKRDARASNLVECKLLPFFVST